MVTPKAATRNQANGRRAGKSTTEFARDELERMILDGEIPTGERLLEQSLAARLGVSRGPVREAIRALETERLITGGVNQGAFVRRISGEEAAELYDVRAVLFGLACQSLARIVTPKQLEELTALMSDMGKAAVANDGASYYRLNLAFHDAVMRFSGRSRTREIYDSLLKELHLLRQRALTSSSRMKQSNDEHKGIVKAIAAGNVELARQLGETHAHSGKRRWLESLNDGMGL